MPCYMTLSNDGELLNRKIHAFLGECLEQVSESVCFSPRQRQLQTFHLIQCRRCPGRQHSPGSGEFVYLGNSRPNGDKIRFDVNLSVYAPCRNVILLLSSHVLNVDGGSVKVSSEVNLQIRDA